MRYYFIFICLCCGVLFYSCNGYKRTKPTEFFLIDSAKSYTGVFQAFVVYNPPEDTLLLRKMIENYNLRTVPVNLLKKYERYTRIFYAKSEFLTRDFKPGERDINPRSSNTYQELNHFTDNILMNIEYAKRYDNSYRYSIYFGRKFAGEKDIIIHDLDSFYHAKWIETADIDTTMVK